MHRPGITSQSGVQFARGTWLSPAGAACFILAHGARQVRLGPVAFWIAVGTLVVMALWTVITGTYFAFREDVLTRLLARQAEMQFGYEDRIADMRAQVDRLSSRQLLDQEQFEQKLDQILRRQTMLEQRATTLNALPDVTGSIKAPARGEPARALPPKPAPMNDASQPAAPPARKATLGSVDAALTRLAASLDRIETEQSGTLAAMEQQFETKARRIRGVLGELGVDASKFAPPDAVGGPFVALRLRPDANSFDKQMQRVGIARAQVERLTRSLGNVPVRKPVPGEVDLSSAFGMRIDPFNRSPAMHTGLDLKGDSGDPAHATAAGTVTIAGWQGGYGKMIEVDHGNGFATRYGHLSAFDVKVGDKVKTGQTVGRVGSTGRSTGPHLHYETRVDGEAVDPHKFLRAGRRLGFVN